MECFRRGEGLVILNSALFSLCDWVGSVRFCRSCFRLAIGSAKQLTKPCDWNAVMGFLTKLPTPILMPASILTIPEGLDAMQQGLLWIPLHRLIAITILQTLLLC
jgi:hypothetical protein